MRGPLPIFCATSAAYAEAAAQGQNPVEAAEREWKSGYDWDREDREPEHLAVLGGELTFEQVLELAPAADEVGDGWEQAESSRTGRLARRLWDILLSFEQTSAR